MKEKFYAPAEGPPVPVTQPGQINLQSNHFKLKACV